MRLLTTLLMLMLLFTACDKNDQTTDSTLSVATFTLEDASLKQYTVSKQGRNVQLDQAKGKVLLLDIFATWCPACKVVAPHLGNIAREYNSSVQVVGIMIDENQPHSVSQAFANTYGATYPISNAKDNHALAARIAADMQQPRSFPIPLLVMYDQNGNYFRHYVGAVPEEMIVRDIQTLLEK